MFTVDASVWMNADSPREPGHGNSRALIDRIAAESVAVVVPTLLLVEVAGVISCTRGDSNLAREYVETMRALPFIRWVDLDELLAEQAASLAARQALRGADAVYAAVASAFDCDLVSLDREHLTRLPPVVRALTPTDALAGWKMSGP